MKDKIILFLCFFFVLNNEIGIDTQESGYNYICPVCMQDEKECLLVTYECGHNYHLNCFKELVIKEGNTEKNSVVCLYCKKEIKKDNIKIFKKIDYCLSNKREQIFEEDVLNELSIEILDRILESDITQSEKEKVEKKIEEIVENEIKCFFEKNNNKNIFVKYLNKEEADWIEKIKQNSILNFEGIKNIILRDYASQIIIKLDLDQKNIESIIISCSKKDQVTNWIEKQKINIKSIKKVIFFEYASIIITILNLKQSYVEKIIIFFDREEHLDWLEKKEINIKSVSEIILLNSIFQITSKLNLEQNKFKYFIERVNEDF